MQRESVQDWLQIGTEWLARMQGRRIVEVLAAIQKAGSAHESTSVFARTGAEVHSLVVDETSSTALSPAAFPNVRLRSGDASQLLQGLPGPIDLLYLDAWAVGTDRYKERHRDLYLSARTKLHDRSVLLINDTDLDFCGKGEQVIYAAEQGDRCTPKLRCLRCSWS